MLRIASPFSTTFEQLLSRYESLEFEASRLSHHLEVCALISCVWPSVAGHVGASSVDAECP